MVDNKSKTKTKSEMLLELESIKGLLHEEDDIPILQETIHQETIHKETRPQETMPQKTIAPEKAVQTVKASITPPVAISKADEQQDLFNKAATADSATQLLNTLNDLAALAETVTTHKNSAPNSTNQSSSSQSISNTGVAEKTFVRTESIKAFGENPFLPAHIRTRLHGNNPPPNFEFETAKKIANVSRPTTQLGNTQNNFATTKPVSHQQEMIDDIIEAMLPHIKKALRDRLAGMSKEMLEILIEENDKF